MSQAKSFPVNPDLFNIINDNTISPAVRAEFDQLIKDLSDPLFFDQHLSNEHMMHILNNRYTIESAFINILHDRIHQLNVDSVIRQRLLNNIGKISMHYLQINNNVPVDAGLYFYLGTDEEFDVDSSDDDFDSDDNEICDDLENLLLDEMDM